LFAGPAASATAAGITFSMRTPNFKQHAVPGRGEQLDFTGR
jgi:hypothetical protein